MSYKRNKHRPSTFIRNPPTENLLRIDRTSKAEMSKAEPILTSNIVELYCLLRP